jgi:predicted P-loop ATPase
MTEPEQPPFPDEEYAAEVVPIHGLNSGISGAVQLLRMKQLRLNEMTMAYELAGQEVNLDAFVAKFRYNCHENLTVGRPPKRLQYSADTVQSAITVVGYERKYHPVREYLTALPPGESGTIEHFASDVLHMGEDDQLGRTLLRMWAIACVRRVFNPGEKFDCVLVFEGEKGLGKSTFFKTMAIKPEWFGEAQMDIESPKGWEAMHATWIYEWQELGPFRQKPLTTVQAFLSTAVDRYVRPYGRGAVARPRSGIIVGTTNNAQFLPEAERRVWATKILSLIDNPRAEMERDAFWAEARDLCVAKEPHSFSVMGDLGASLNASQETFTAEHPWSQDVTTWLAKDPTEVTTREALRAAGFGAQKPPTRRDEMDMAELLKALGYRRNAQPTKLALGGRARLWCTTSTTNQ